MASKKPQSVLVYGLRAAQAAARYRQKQVRRAHLQKSRLGAFQILLKAMATKQLPYHVVNAEDLEKLADSVHHEGVVLELDADQPWFDEELLEAARTWPAKTLLLGLDGVQNPHNLGSIVRVAAHFGVPAVFGAKGQFPKLSPSAVRVAEGGAEFVRTAELTRVQSTVAVLKKLGFKVYATSGHGGRSVFREKLAPRSVIMLGAETEGISEFVASIADGKLQIPGTAQIESLNVATAAAVFAGEHWRQTRN